MITKGKCKTSADVTNVLNASGVVEGSLDISKRQSTFQGSTYTLNSHNRSNVSQFKQETIACHRKFKNSPKEINNFFFNLCKFKDKKDQKELSHKRSKSGGQPTKSTQSLASMAGKSRASEHIPFQLLMSNFRRKKILEVMQEAHAGKISFDE